MATTQTPTAGKTTYHALHIHQEDKRPVIICRYYETAAGFANLYKDLGLGHTIRPIQISDEEFENWTPPPVEDPPY